MAERESTKNPGPRAWEARSPGGRWARTLEHARFVDACAVHRGPFTWSSVPSIFFFFFFSFHGRHLIKMKEKFEYFLTRTS